MPLVDEKVINVEQKLFLSKLAKEAESFLPTELSLVDFSDKNLLKLVYAFLLTKYLRTFNAILVLIDKGFGEDANMLSRSLFEIWVKAIYADHHSEEAAYLFRMQFGRAIPKDIGRYRKVHGSPLPDGVDYMGEE